MGLWWQVEDAALWTLGERTPGPQGYTATGSCRMRELLHDIDMCLSRRRLRACAGCWAWPRFEQQWDLQYNNHS